MSQLERLIPRHAQSVVEAALADTRVVLVNGARQAGKSTLAGLIADAVDDAEFRPPQRASRLAAL